MQYTVYILFSKKRKLLYVGRTNDIVRRMEEHNTGLSGFTRPGMPWVLVWSCLKGTDDEAFVLEMKLKNLSFERKVRFIEKFEEGITPT